MSDDQEKVDDWEWSHRILCSDGNCIGVIGPDGRCKECGKPYEGSLPSGLTEQPEHLDRVPAEVVETTAADSDPEEQSPASDDAEWSQRRLCSDENCIGVIGPDGLCKECGKKAER